MRQSLFDPLLHLIGQKLYFCNGMIIKCAHSYLNNGGICDAFAKEAERGETGHSTPNEGPIGPPGR